MVGEACLPSNAYYPRTPDYTLCSGVHVCWSEQSDSSFVYGFMILDYGFGTMTATTFVSNLYQAKLRTRCRAACRPWRLKRSDTKNEIGLQEGRLLAPQADASSHSKHGGDTDSQGEGL